MKPTPDLYDRLRADAARAAQKAPRRGRNPWEPIEEPSRRTYADPTADEALRNIAREQRAKARKDPRR